MTGVVWFVSVSLMTARPATGVATAVLAAALGLIGCGSDSTTAGQHQPSPVSILQKSGCPVLRNVVSQDSLDHKSYYASCTWGDPTLFKTTLTVWAYGSNADRDADLPNVHRQDGRAIIVGPRFIAELDAGLTGTFSPSPAKVAAAIEGVITP